MDAAISKLVTVVSQAGSAGILAVLVCWLLPRWMNHWQRARREEREEIAAERKATREATDRLVNTFRDDQAAARAALVEITRYEREQCAEQFRVMMDDASETRRAILEALSEVREQSVRSHAEVMGTLEAVRHR